MYTNKPICADFQVFLNTFSPLKLTFFFIFVMGSYANSQKFHILLILTEKINQNCLSGMYIGFEACQIQWCWFWEILSSSIWSKHLCVFLRNKYGFQIGNAIKKYKLCFDQEEMLKTAWYSMHLIFWTCWFQWHRFWGCTFRAICMHYLGTCSS